MDREITRSEKRRVLRRRALIWGGAAAAVIGTVVSVIALAAPKVSVASLTLSAVAKGDVVSTVSATGRVIPAYEETLVTPVATRIREVFVAEGDTVTGGQVLLRLDLEGAQAEYRRMADEVEMKRYESRQNTLDGETRIGDLEMQIKAKRMAVAQLKADVGSERRLDSIGSGTGERVRQAELAWRTGELELEQMERRLENMRRVESAGQGRMRLEGEISARNMAEAARTLEDARLAAPRGGTVTWLNSSIGTMLGAGEKVAVISDLSHFRISAEISEGHGDKLVVGAPVMIRVGRTETRGHISNMTAQSKSGVIGFIVTLDNPEDTHRLRAGLNAEVNVIYDERPGVLRIANGPYFSGEGEYEMWVREDDRLVRRRVRLGDSNPQWVEVRSGLVPGEEVVVSDMKAYERRGTLRLAR